LLTQEVNPIPYIKSRERERLSEISELILKTKIDTAGNLQYLIALLTKSFMTDKEKKYQDHNDVMGALDGAAREYYRRKVAPYEQEKINENGDVY